MLHFLQIGFRIINLSETHLGHLLKSNAVNLRQHQALAWWSLESQAISNCFSSFKSLEICWSRFSFIAVTANTTINRGVVSILNISSH